MISASHANGASFRAHVDVNKKNRPLEPETRTGAEVIREGWGKGVTEPSLLPPSHKPNCIQGDAHCASPSPQQHRGHTMTAFIQSTSSPLPALCDSTNTRGPPCIWEYPLLEQKFASAV